jgi:Putative zinc-finger
MNCNSFEELIALHVEGDLEFSQAISVELHLKSCTSCQRFLAELRASQALVKDLAEESLDPASFNVVRQRVMQVVNRQQAAHPIWWRFLPPALAEWRPAWAAALVALVALGFLLQWHFWQRPGQSDRVDTPRVASTPTVLDESPEDATPGPAGKAGQPSLELGTNQVARRLKTSVAQELLLVGTRTDTVTEEPEPAVEQGTNLQPEPLPPADISAEPPPPLVIKLVTDDPNIVIVWLVDQEVPTN